ncbi:hypothetical protein LAY57_28410 [Argonema antarcticum A004/B2]|nr:hypothetical protein [Argonema antarcticum A004/B2]
MYRPITLRFIALKQQKSCFSFKLNSYQQKRLSDRQSIKIHTSSYSTDIDLVRKSETI